MRAKFLIALLGALFVLTHARARAGHLEEGVQDRLGPGPADAEPVRRLRRGGLPRLGHQLGPAGQLRPEGPRRRRPGIAKSWDVSPTRRPSPSSSIRRREVVRRPADHQQGRQVQSLDVLGGNGALFTGYTDNVTSITTPDPTRSWSTPKKPDARIVGGLFIYMLPEAHLGQAAGQGAHRHLQAGDADGRQRAVHDHRVQAQPDHPDGAATRTSAGPKPKFDEIQYIKYGNERRGRARAHARRDRHGHRGPAVDVRPAGQAARTSRRPGAVAVVHRARVQPVPGAALPGREVQPGRSRTATCARRSPTRSTASGSTRSPPRGTSFPGHGILPNYYKAFYEQPEQTTRTTRTWATRCSTTPAGCPATTASARRAASARSSTSTCARSPPYNIQAASSSRRRPKAIGVKFDVQVVSVDKLTELTTQKVNGKMAPDFDTFIWGWGGDPYDPSFLLSLVTTERDRRLVRLVLLEPRVRQALRRSRPASSTSPQRKEIVKQLVGLTQRDLPYLVLTVDPILQAYRTDRVSAAPSGLPAGATATSSASRSATRRCSTLGPPGAAAAAKTAERQRVELRARIVAIVVVGVVLGVSRVHRHPAPPRVAGGDRGLI